MSPLSITFIYYTLSKYLTVKEIVKLGETCKDLHVLCNDETILKYNFFKDDISNNINYKNYLVLSFLKNSRSICGICKKYMTIKVVLSFHNCNICKRCIRCDFKECECDKIVYYHKDCVNYDNYFFKCPLCNQSALGFELNINI